MKHEPMITASALSDLLAMRIPDYVRQTQPLTKGRSYFYRALVKSTKKSNRFVLALDRLYYRSQALKLFTGMTRDLHTFCQRTNRTLLRVHALDPIPDVQTRTGLLLEFSDPIAADNDHAFAA